MAFNKDQAQLGKLGNSFRQVSAALSAHPSGAKRGKGGVPYFVDMYVPSKHMIDTVRLIPGDYIQEKLVGDGDDAKAQAFVSPFIKFVEHFDGVKHKGIICSAGPFANFKDKRQPCRGCDIFWATIQRGEKGRLESSRISRQNKYAFSVLDYSNYHKVEQQDFSTGEIRRNNQGQPYYNWLKCEGQICQYCRAQKETKQGHVTHWPINWTQLQSIRNADAGIGSSCKSCGSVGSVKSVAWVCTACGDDAVDMATTQLKMDEIAALTEGPYQCKCGNLDCLTEIYECSVCDRQGTRAERATLFDVDLRVQIVDIAGKGVLQISGWSAPSAIPPQFASIAKAVDLVARYAPDPLERQIAKLGDIPVPQQPSQLAPMAAQEQQPHAYSSGGGRNPVTSYSPAHAAAPAAESYMNPYSNRSS